MRAWALPLCGVVIGNKNWNVFTDKEVDAELEAALDDAVDGLGIPRDLRKYFDAGAWKKDALVNGRGAILSDYDNLEVKVTLSGVDYYIYRQS